MLKVLGAVTIGCFIFATIVFAQEKAKPVTVCEVLGDLKNYGRKPIAVLGRLDCTYTVIDTHCYLVDDRCSRPVVQKGDTWPNRIWLEFNYTRPRVERTEIDDTALLEKLSFVRKSTALGTHNVMQFKSIDGVIEAVGWGDEPDKWGVAYGRILRKRTSNSFGAPVALEVNSPDLRSIKDEDYPQPSQQK